MARWLKAQIPRGWPPGRPGLGACGDAGFALIAVIWSLGLIILLGSTFIVGARYRARFSSDYLSVAATRLAAESAVNLAIAMALASTNGSNLGFPLTCRMPGGETATITIEEENGKVDLNTATPAVLARFFTALTGDTSQGTQITARVIEFRANPGTQPDAGTNGRSGPPIPGFTTIMQLDEVAKLPPRLFRAALRFVTVSSGRPEPDPAAATPALLQLLAAEPNRSNLIRGLPIGGTVTVRADVSGPNGTRFIREALVSLTAENGRPFAIREWRQGDIGSAAPPASQNRFRRCIEFSQTAAN